MNFHGYVTRSIVLQSPGAGNHVLMPIIHSPAVHRILLEKADIRQQRPIAARYPERGHVTHGPLERNFKNP
jgi:hypothetical protein